MREGDVESINVGLIFVFQLLILFPSFSAFASFFLTPYSLFLFSHQTNHDCPIIEEYAGSVATQIEKITLRSEEFLSGGMAGFSGKHFITQM